MWGAHLREDLIQPLQGPVQVHLDPAGGAGDVLPVILRPPALRRGESDDDTLKHFLISKCQRFTSDMLWSK